MPEVTVHVSRSTGAKGVSVGVSSPSNPSAEVEAGTGVVVVRGTRIFTGTGDPNGQNLMDPMGGTPTLGSLYIQDTGQLWMYQTTSTGVAWVWTGIDLGGVGPAGATGPPGPSGPTGPPGPIAATYTHVQTTPATVWTIIHNLGYFPNVTVVDTQGEQVEGEVDFTSGSTVIVTFSAAFAGKAFLS